jgi:ubiquinone/menaquinone biosynthesis C-methylase UbiE
MSKSKQFWDKQSVNYDNTERQFEPIFEQIINLTKKHLKNSDKAMDFGCATGTKTFQLSDSVSHMHGFDISPNMIEIAKKKAAELNIANVDFSSGTLDKNNFQSEQFDVIISYGVMHLIDDIDDALQKIHGLLKPGGLFISSSACMKDKMAFKNRMQFLMYMTIKVLGIFPLHLNLWRCEDIEIIVAKNNFNIIEKQRLFYGISVSYIVAQKEN